MMKAIIIFVVFVSVALARPSDDNKVYPEIIKSEYVNNGDKGYNFA